MFLTHRLESFRVFRHLNLGPMCKKFMKIVLINSVGRGGKNLTPPLSAQIWCQGAEIFLALEL